MHWLLNSDPWAELGSCHLTCEVVLCVQQFTADVSLQLVGFVSVRRRASLPVHPALAQPTGIESICSHPHQHSPLQAGRWTRGTLIWPPLRWEAVHGQGHHVRASSRQIVLLWGAGSDVASLQIGSGRLPHQSVPEIYGHVQTEVWRRRGHRLKVDEKVFLHSLVVSFCFTKKKEPCSVYHSPNPYYVVALHATTSCSSLVSSIDKVLDKVSVSTEHVV